MSQQDILSPLGLISCECFKETIDISVVVDEFLIQMKVKVNPEQSPFHLPHLETPDLMTACVL